MGHGNKVMGEFKGGMSQVLLFLFFIKVGKNGPVYAGTSSYNRPKVAVFRKASL